MNDEIRTARNWVNLMNPLYLDTETTGLGPDAEIVSIAIVDDAGQVLLDQLVQPVKPIPSEAEAIHGIANADVAAAPTWDAVWPQVRELVRNRLVVIYNADFDARMVAQSGQARGIVSRLSDWCSYKCAMLLYADYYGEWDEYHGNNKWQKLEKACRQQRVKMADILPHAAAGDCELTRRLVHKLAEQEGVSAHA